MSQPNPGGGSSGHPNSNKNSQRGREQKRQRGQLEDSSDSDTSLERSVRPRTDSTSGQSQQRDLARCGQSQAGNQFQVHSMLAVQTPTGNQVVVSNPLPVTISGATDASRQLATWPQNTLVAYSEVDYRAFRDNMRGERLDKKRLEYREAALAKSRSRPPPVVVELDNKLTCKVCKGKGHDADHCKYIITYDPKVKPWRDQGFKKWCPHHKSTTHKMDECKQRWTWLRDEGLVRKYLIDNCTAGPAFATNLLDWRVLLSDAIVCWLPWTPQYANRVKADHPDFHLTSDVRVDPTTNGSHSALLALAWQTENKQDPQFLRYEDLQRHAEEQYQQQKNREEAAVEKFRETIEEQEQLEYEDANLKKVRQQLKVDYARNKKVRQQLEQKFAQDVAENDEDRVQLEHEYANNKRSRGRVQSRLADNHKTREQLEQEDAKNAKVKKHFAQILEAQARRKRNHPFIAPELPDSERESPEED